MTRESAVLELQHAILDVINGNSHLVTTHECSAYDYVPQEVVLATKPYVEIGEPMETPWDCFCEALGQRVAIRLHVWSTYQGKKQAAEIITHLKELLCGTTLTITGYTHVRTRADFNNVMKDPDMKHYHGVLDLAVNVMQT
jgi:hypothetical protein